MCLQTPGIETPQNVSVTKKNNQNITYISLAVSIKVVFKVEWYWEEAIHAGVSAVLKEKNNHGHKDLFTLSVGLE